MNLYEETKFIMKQNNITANKSLGQNCLIDENVVDCIVSSAEITEKDLVIEIGPGLGTLTKKLLEKAGKVICIELDPKMVKILTNRFNLYEKFEILNEDVLKVDLKELINKNKKDKEVMDFLKKNHVKYLLTETNMLNKICKQNHQGIIIEREEYTYFKLEEIINEEFLVILDHIEDPHNFGAIIRTAEAAGVDGIIIPKDRSVSVNATVMKTSVGTLNKMKIVKVTNLVETVKKLQKNNFFVYGADMVGSDIRQCSFASKKVLVIGNEGKGISDLLKKNCDEMVSIPMKGEVNSLNASVAGAILIFKMGGLS